MHNKIRFYRLMSVVFVMLCFFFVEPQAYGATKGLKVQLVLETKDTKTSIPYKVADQVVDHLSQSIKETAFTSILRGSDKIILTFFSPLNCRNEIPGVISSINKLPSAAFIKLGTWKQEEMTLPPEIAFESNNNQPDSENKTTLLPVEVQRGIYQHSFKQSSYYPHQIKFKFERNTDNFFHVEAVEVPLGMLLESMASASDFEYICPQTIGQRKMSIYCKSVSIASLLSALKLSLNLSIKKTGRIVTFVEK